MFTNTIAKRIIPVSITDEMKSSYLDYAMSVIIARALPDVRDGLKPVHRRILYSMDNLSLYPDRPHRKSATIVGDVLGKYHPHGDSSVYDALVRMAQDFSLRYPLVDGHGNFGSVDGDPAAAYRYTEARLSSITLELLRDLDKDTVEFIPNFDNSLKEPTVLPALLPNLLIGGSDGIAVGMATKIPPHNLGETLDAIVAYIDNPDITFEELMHIMPGPDFPTGAQIIGRKGIRDAYMTGHGSITLRPKVSFEKNPKGTKDLIVITEIPYQVNKAKLVEKIAELARDKKIKGIQDLRDESDRTGMRIVIEVKKDVNTQVVLNQLYKKTPLQSNFNVNALALVDGTPKILTLKDMIHYYLEHRRVVVKRRTAFLLNKAKARAHIVEGLQIALDHLDEVIHIIRSSKNPDIARTSLMESFEFTLEQVNAILEMRLSRLTGLEVDKLNQEYTELLKDIAKYEEILASERRLLAEIKLELSAIRDKFSDDRKTVIVDEEVEMDEIDFIVESDVVLTITHHGYIKKMPLNTYKSQRRGGKGIIGIVTKEGDFVEHIFVTSTHHKLLFFTNMGKCYRLMVHHIGDATRYAKGTAIVNLVNMLPNEKITAVIPVKDFTDDKYLFMATRNGYVKKTELKEYDTSFRNVGLNAIKLSEGDELIGVEMTSGNQEIILGTKNGMAIHFDEANARPMGKMTRGVRGIRLKEDDSVVAMVVIREESYLLTVTSSGYGKLTLISAYSKQRRGGKGRKSINLKKARGIVVGMKQVSLEDEIFIITKEQGNIIRIKLKGISIIGRNTRGVRFIKLKDQDEVTALALITGSKEVEDDGEIQEDAPVEQLMFGEPGEVYEAPVAELTAEEDDDDDDEEVEEEEEEELDDEEEPDDEEG
ncbi:MAG: DNA gyrase subunit A [Candidatus Eremiobacterota bacterium]